MKIEGEGFVIQETQTYAAHTRGVLSASSKEGFNNGRKAFFDHYPPAGYSSSVGDPFIKNGTWSTTTVRLSSCE